MPFQSFHLREDLFPWKSKMLYGTFFREPKSEWQERSGSNHTCVIPLSPKDYLFWQKTLLLNLLSVPNRHTLLNNKEITVTVLWSCVREERPSGPYQRGLFPGQKPPSPKPGWQLLHLKSLPQQILKLLQVREPQREGRGSHLWLPQSPVLNLNRESQACKRGREISYHGD